MDKFGESKEKCPIFDQEDFLSEAKNGVKRTLLKAFLEKKTRSRRENGKSKTSFFYFADSIEAERYK